MEAATQVTRECEKHAVIKWATWVKPPWNRGQWLDYWDGRPWQICLYWTTCQSKWCNTITMVEAITRWLEIHAVTHTTAWNSIWALTGKLCGDVVPQKELSQPIGLFAKQPHRLLGQETQHWLGISHSLSPVSLWKGWMVQWTVKDCWEHWNTGM